MIGLQGAASFFVLAAWLFGDVSWLALTLAVGLSVAGLSIMGNRDNLLFFIRTVFIIWIGLVPALAIYMGGYFAYRMPFVQTTEVAFILTIITTLSLFSSQLGIEAGRKLRVRQRGVDLPGNERITVYFVIALLILTGTLIALRRGEMVIFAGYASATQGGLPMPINNLQSIANLLLFFGIVLFFRMQYFNRLDEGAARNIRFLKYALVFAGIYVAVWSQLLRGARMDPLTLVFGSFVLVAVFKGGSLRLSAKGLIWLTVAFLVVQLWGGLRGYLHAGSVDLDRVTNIVRDLYRGGERDDIPIYFRQGTMNNLSLSVATTVYAIEKGDLDYQYGRSYAEYIARTPPAFLYPNRPRSWAWMSSDLYGGGGAGGGYNEMAEAYLNFGILGSLIVPGVISFFLSYSFHQFLINRFNILRSIVFLSILGVFFRGLLYQSFTFYKVFVTALVLYGVLIVFKQVVVDGTMLGKLRLSYTQQGSNSI